MLLTDVELSSRVDSREDKEQGSGMEMITLSRDLSLPRLPSTLVPVPIPVPPASYPWTDDG